jgi:NAD(P)-dependent dehydrogenase (short-subunit alcohol dehydrogenase family)
MSRIIAVTGAGRGLGHSIVTRHLELGDTVYAFYNRTPGALEALAQKYKTLKRYKCDIASDAEVAAATAELLAAEKQVDIVYNVAGIFKFEGRVGLAETDMALCMQMFNVNALGSLRFSKALFLLLQKGSVVVNISSEAGSIGASRRKEEYGYTMSKAAMNMGTKILSNELRETGIRVMSLHPGWLKTDMGGPDAFKSDHAVLPEVSAENIINIILNIDAIPRDQLYMTHTGEILPW